MDDVGRHLRIGEAKVGAAVGDGEVGLVLVGVGEDRYVAGLRLSLGVALLSGARLDGHGVPAQRLQAVESLGAVGPLVKTLAGRK